MRVLDALTDLDHVVEHALDAIESRDQVAKSGWVGFRQDIRFDLLGGSDRSVLDDETGGWSDGLCRH